MDSTHRPVPDEVEPGRGARRRRTPTWVIAFFIVIALVVAILVISAVLGVEHGPARHAALESASRAGAA